MKIEYDYSVEGEYWTKNITVVRTESINSYGTYEGTLADENIWFADSASAYYIANRKILYLKEPQREFDVDTTLLGLHRQLSDDVRLVDSFFNITSQSGWTVTEYKLNMKDGGVKYLLSEVAGGNAFILDYSLLDGDDLLL